ncbi:hypothetical protein Peur_042461 [Populus x canadensis]
MIFHRKVGVAAARGRRYSGAKAAIIFLFWILFILAQLGLLIAFGHEETGKLVKSLPRKARFFETRFHAPPSQDQPLDIDKGDPETVYEDDKRIIHTDLLSSSPFLSKSLFDENTLSFNRQGNIGLEFEVIEHGIYA